MSDPFMQQIEEVLTVAMEHLEKSPNDLKALWSAHFYGKLAKTTKEPVKNAMEKFEATKEKMGQDALNQSLHDLDIVGYLADTWLGLSRDKIGVWALPVIGDELIAYCLDPETLYNCAKKCVDLKLWHLAEKFLKAVLDVQSEHERSLSLLYRVLNQQNKHKQAEALIVDRNSSDPVILTNQAWAMIQKGDFKQAREKLEKALTSKDASAETLMNYLGVLNELGLGKEGFDVYKKYPQRSEAVYANAIKSCIQIGTKTSLEQGERILSEAQKAYPNRTNAYLPWNGACLLTSIHKLEAAKILALEALELAPQMKASIVNDPELAPLKLWSGKSQK